MVEFNKFAAGATILLLTLSMVTFSSSTERVTESKPADASPRKQIGRPRRWVCFFNYYWTTTPNCQWKQDEVEQLQRQIETEMHKLNLCKESTSLSGEQRKNICMAHSDIIMLLKSELRTANTFLDNNC